MSRMDSFFNRSLLNTTVSRKVIWFSEISAVNLMVAVGDSVIRLGQVSFS